MDFLYFILLIGILIFIHELGHFAFAKIFGVKVLTFSIGFGPKILRIRGKETEYCVGILPFGGFVEMLEESKRKEPLLPEDRHRTFESQPLWRRMIIVLAGPAMNILFPLVLYASVYFEDRELLPAVVGAVVPNKPAEGRLYPGDRILAIEGEAMTSFAEVQRVVGKNAGNPLRFSIERDGKIVGNHREKAALDVTVTPVDELETHELDMVEHVGRVGIVPRFAAPVIGVARPDSPAARAGLRTFDRIVAVNDQKIETYLDLVSVLSSNRGQTVTLFFSRPVDVPSALGGLCEFAVYEPGVAQLTPIPPPEGSSANDTQARMADLFARTGIETSEMYVSFVPEGSSEWKAGLRAGDRVATLNGVPHKAWKSMEDEIVRDSLRAHELRWTRGGEPMGGTFQVRREEWVDEFGQHYERYVFRTTHWVPYAADALVPNPSPFWYALRKGAEETQRVIKIVGLTFVRIAQGRVSLSSVGGPITVWDIAGQAGAKGTTSFLWAMAFISANLGLLNLLPIPVLDGGHLLFFVVEGIRRKPLPIRVREIASLVGIAVLMLLVIVAFKNDIERRSALPNVGLGM